MIDAYTEDGVKGPAYIMVPISENPVNRAVFNGVAKAEFGRPLKDADEIEEVWRLQTSNYGDAIDEALEDFGVVDPTDEDDQRELESAIEEAVE